MDLFVNDHPSFVLWADRIATQLAGRAVWQTHVLLREARFVRLEISGAGLSLKVEMVISPVAGAAPMRTLEALPPPRRQGRVAPFSDAPRIEIARSGGITMAGPISCDVD